MSYDLGASYRAARERLSALLADGSHAATIVPATPVWTVHDVLSHLSGVSVDAATGNMAGAPGDAWTDAQVQRGKSATDAALIAQWAEHGPVMEGLLSSPQGAMASAAVMDVHCHECDVLHALGRDNTPPAEFLAWAGGAMRDRFVAQVAEAGLAPVEVTIDDFEWFRARLGRRTEAEVRSYAWSADPTPYLDLFFIFGRAATPLGER